MSLHTEIANAAARISPHVRRTPLERSPYLSAISGADVYLKLENLQVTGSFKARGALNKLLVSSEAAERAGVVTASSGNHGAAVAHGGHLLGLDVEVYVPTVAAPSKLASIRALGGRVEIAGSDCVETEALARVRAADTGRVYIPPYNDLHVMAGQGTVGVEIAASLPQVDAVFVSVGGGGLIAGTGSWLKHAVSPDVEMVAVSPARSPALHRSLEVGEIIDVPCEETLSDGTAGGVEAGTITFEVCQQVVDESLLVDEADIAAGIRLAIEHHHTLIEGAAGVAIAGFLSEASAYKGKRVVIVICGGNIGLEKLRSVLC